MALAARALRCQHCAALRGLLKTRNHTSLALIRKESSNADKRKTHFGFESVTEEEKEEKVYQVFHNVADTYDVMNDAMSIGIHRLWKDHFIQRLAPLPGTKLLDVAGGTGDIAFRFLKYVSYEKENGNDVDDFNIRMPRDITAGVYGDVGFATTESDSSDDSTNIEPSHVTVCDINHAMLDVGRKRAQEAGLNQGISWIQGNAESLPVPDNTYDAYTIAFGIRNCTHIDKVLSEAYRVLKPGGRFMCLEFSQMPNPILQRFYDDYSFQVIPVMGQIIAGDWKSYQYLVESIRQFPNQETFCSMLREAGFRFVKYENLLFGISAIHSGFKL